MIRWNMGHTTGNVWNFVKLPAYTETVIVRLKPCYPETAGQIEQYYIGTGNEIYTGILRPSMPTFIASVFILLAGFFYHVLLGVLFTTAAI